MCVGVGARIKEGREKKKRKLMKLFPLETLVVNVYEVRTTSSCSSSSNSGKTGARGWLNGTLKTFQTMHIFPRMEDLSWPLNFGLSVSSLLLVGSYKVCLRSACLHGWVSSV